MDFVTRQGMEVLGNYLKKAREERGWTQDELIAQIFTSTGMRIGKTTLSELERGNREPRWNTLAAIALTGIAINPVSNQPYDTAQLFWIACEKLNPDTGEIR